jgi:hypothetical protein
LPRSKFVDPAPLGKKVDVIFIGRNDASREKLDGLNAMSELNSDQQWTHFRNTMGGHKVSNNIDEPI